MLHGYPFENVDAEMDIHILYTRRERLIERERERGERKRREREREMRIIGNKKKQKDISICHLFSTKILTTQLRLFMWLCFLISTFLFLSNFFLFSRCRAWAFGFWLWLWLNFLLKAVVAVRCSPLGRKTQQFKIQTKFW